MPPHEEAPLLRALRAPDAATRATACSEAVADVNAVLWLDALVEALGDGDRGVRRAAAGALVRLAEQSAEVAPALRRALRGAVPRARFPAAWALARIEAPGPALLPPAVEALRTGSRDERWAASRLLVEIGRLHGEAASAVRGLAASDGDLATRRLAIHCLRELAPAEAQTASLCLEASHSDDPALRRAALTAMASLEANGPALSDRLCAVLEAHDDGASRRIAALSLGAQLARGNHANAAQAHRALERAAHEATDPDLARAATIALQRAGQ